MSKKEQPDVPVPTEEDREAADEIKREIGPFPLEVWATGEIKRLLARHLARHRIRAVEQEKAWKREALSTMSQALSALESDSDIDARRAAFERIQDCFEGVGVDDYDDWDDPAARAIREEKADPARISLKDWPETMKRVKEELRQSERITGKDLATRITGGKP